MGSRIETKLLGELVSEARGISYGIVQPGPDTVDGVPIVRVCDINGDSVNSANLKRVSSDIAAKYSRTCIRGGELLVSVVGTPGLCVIAGKELKGSNLARAIAMVPIEGNLLTRWCRYQILSLAGQQYIEQCLNTTVQKTLNLKELANMPIPIPSRETMAKSVQLLDSIERLARANQRTNDYLEQCLLARYDHLFGHVGSCDGTISDIGDVVGGATPSKKKPEYYCHDGIGWITPRDLSNTIDKFIAHGADDITQTGFESCSVKKLPAGTVLFSSRAPIGYIAIATDEVTTNQGFKSVVPRPEIGTAFVYCFLVRNKDRIADAGSGTTFPEVSGKTMAGIELALPDIDLCAEFEEWAAPLLEHQCNLEEENRQLGNLRDALLPKLMTGEIDVSRMELPTQPNNHLFVD